MDEDHTLSHSGAAIALVERLLADAQSAEPLAVADLMRHHRRRPAVGWRIALPEACGSRQVDVLLPRGFPWAPPTIVLVDPPPFGEWPHVESDGALCLLDASATTDPFDPRGVMRHLLVEAAALVAELAAGGLREDFRTEFRSYWPGEAGASRGQIVSICNPDGQSRAIRCWYGRSYTLIGDSVEAIGGWLANRGWDRKKQPITVPAVLASLGTPPLPQDYPSDGTSLLALLEREDPAAAELAKSALVAETESLIVALRVATVRGPALVAAVLDRPRVRNGGGYARPDPITKGFRQGRVHPLTLVRRFASGNTVHRSNIERADASWVHGRDQGAGFARLRSSHVAVVGCGSLGSPVVRLLAQAGIGRMTLIDPDVLGWPNVGRHTLGASHVGSPKARAMAETIRQDFPHLKGVVAVDDGIESLLSDGSEALRGLDAIVSTTGHWLSNAALQHWASVNPGSPPLVFGWLEARACAGHAVAVRPPAGCLCCGFDGTGRPQFRATEWGDDGGDLREPACGASFQPYGASEATMCATLIVDMALDVLLGHASFPSHRIWGARSAVLERNGGRWSPEWLGSAPNASSGGMILERPWTQATRCVACEDADPA